MSDDLMIPTVPEPKPEDPEDVSWALSTAEAMWARGDHLEGIKWVRRAAEAASEAEDDNRALELAKAAADLAGMISQRMSHASIDIEEVVPISEPTVAAAPPPPVPAKKPPPAKPAAPAVAKPVGKGVSRPPAPLPSKTSQPPPAAKPASLRPGAVGGAKKSRRSRENLDAEAKAAFGGGVGINANANANAIDTAALDAAAAAFLPSDTSETAAIDVPNIQRALQQRRAQEDPTIASNVNDIKAAVAKKQALQLAPESDPLSREREEMGKSTDEWDAAATQNLSGDELPFPDLHSAGGDHDRMTSVNAPPTPDFKTTMQSFPRPAPKAAAAKSAAATSGTAGAASSGTSPPATVVGQGLAGGGFAFGGAAPMPTTSRALRNESGEQHDPGIVTTQAVRVVVWRDANGVHVAPAGTVVSAITVEAVLVALEPHADLTAWLSPSK